MAYTVLARKYRSRTFDEIVGQEAIATTLKNAIDTGRIHHGYLFTGTRGVGKTSMARILAKALNCLSVDAPTVTPCCECELCRSVSEGNDVDVIEIDAASNTGVDNIRELRSNSIYRPARSRYKVYIIDEVHMLSQGAFNALLKTLEEPPEHVKFVFATTEPQRVPATIHSRCQRFDFRSISVDKITAQLGKILEAEEVEADDAVLRRVARLANGSMRDGLSLLDQLLSLGAATLSVDLVDEILPAPHNELLAELVDALAANDPAAALEGLDKCVNEGHSLEQLCGSLIEYLRQLLVVAVCGAETELIDVPAPVREQLAGQARQFDTAGLSYMVAVTEELRRSVRFSGSGRALAEAALVRLATMDRFADIESLLGRLQGQGPSSATSGSSSPARQAPARRAPGRRSASDTKPWAENEAAEPRAPRAREQKPAGSRQKKDDSSPSSSTPKPDQGNASARIPRSSPVTGKERREALSEPMVQKTLELFEGELANVEKEPPGNRKAPKPKDA